MSSYDNEDGIVGVFIVILVTLGTFIVVLGLELFQWFKTAAWPGYVLI